MAYAVQTDIVDAYGLDLLSAVADRDGEIDTVAVERALVSATAIIDAHVGTRYPTPLSVVPDLVRDLCVDIAVYKIATIGNGLNEEKRTRYEDALALLKRISAGQANLDIPSPAAIVPTGSVLLDEAPRVFTRDTLRGF